MRVLVLGARGMLGRDLTQCLIEKSIRVTHSTRSLPVFNDLSFLKFDPLDSNLRSLESFDIIVNCIGVVKKIADQDPINTIKVNGIFPLELAEFCQSKKIECIHISTDCVFDGRKGDYIESDPHNALDLYGKSKSIGESDRCMVLRTSIIGEERYGTKGLVSWIQSQKDSKIDGYVNHLWNGFTTKTLSEVIYQIIKLGDVRPGVHHLFSDKISKYDLVCEISKKYNLNCSISPIEHEMSVDRTLSTVKSLQWRVPSIPIRDQIALM